MPDTIAHRPAALIEIARCPLKTVVVERIIAGLIGGELQPGQWITESGLAKQFEVAQNTVREALIELEHRGFIERPSERKTRVTVLTRRDTREVYAIRIPLEKMVFDELASLRGLDWAAVETALEDMSEAAKANDVAAFENADFSFHRTLWTFADNRHLTDILERLVGKMFAFWLIVARRRHVPAATLRGLVHQHAEIVRHLKAGDAEGAKQALEMSMDRTWEDDLDLPSDSEVATDRGASR